MKHNKKPKKKVKLFQKKFFKNQINFFIISHQIWNRVEQIKKNRRNYQYKILQQIKILKRQKIKMKRISQQVNHTQMKTAKNLGNQVEFIRRDNKRHQTMVQSGQKKIISNNQNISLVLKKNVFYTSPMVVDRLIDDLINGLTEYIQKIEINKIIQSSIKMTNSITSQLYYMQNPKNSHNQSCHLAQKQPFKNQTDPISGFNKQNFVKRQQKSNKKHYSAFSQENSFIIERKQSECSNQQTSETQKKLPPLMKQLSQQKLQQFIPLDEILCIRSSIKKPSYDLQEVVRERFLKEIENRKFKEKIQKINNALLENSESAKSTKRLKKNGASRSTYDLNLSADKSNIVKQDCNFDYDGNKIQVSSNSKPKTNLKILKPLYKLNKQKAQENKTSKLNKKYHERMSFVPRGSRNSLQFNSKIISDIDNTNYTLALKEKLQAQLRKTDMKFMEKQILTKDKLSQQDKLKINNRRESVLNLH